MIKEELEFYLKTSIYTNYLPYKDYYQSLPDDIEELSKLIYHQVIHRGELVRSYLNKPNPIRNEEKVDFYNEKDAYPWYRNRCDDDILLTAPAITAELFRQDNRGFVMGREIKDRIVITCRYVSVLLASILKAKGIPSRCRSGYANYFCSQKDCYYDHWIVQYYNSKSKRWVNVDADGLYQVDFNQWDIPDEEFKYPAKIWLDVRKGIDSEKKYIHGTSLNKLSNLAYALFFDFHSLMNDEISYLFFPVAIAEEKDFANLSNKELEKIDTLAKLMLNPDDNFDELRYLFRNDKWLRTINTPLLSKEDHLELETDKNDY